MHDQTAHFIADRSLSLSYEAVQFPATAETSLAWLHRAVGWAEKRGLTALVHEIQEHCHRVVISQTDNSDFEFDVLELSPEQIVSAGTQQL